MVTLYDVGMASHLPPDSTFQDALLAFFIVCFMLVCAWVAALSLVSLLCYLIYRAILLV